MLPRCMQHVHVHVPMQPRAPACMPVHALVRML